MVTIQVTRENTGIVTSKIYNLQIVRKGKLEEKIIHEGLDRAYERVRTDIRVKTGYAKSTIRTETKGGVGTITVNAFYARFLETGTKHARPFPFFWLNVHSSVDTILSEIRNLYTMK